MEKALILNGEDFIGYEALIELLNDKSIDYEIFVCYEAQVDYVQIDSSYFRQIRSIIDLKNYKLGSYNYLILKYEGV